LLQKNKSSEFQKAKDRTEIKLLRGHERVSCGFHLDAIKSYVQPAQLQMPTIKLFAGVVYQKLAKKQQHLVGIQPKKAQTTGLKRWRLFWCFFWDAGQ